MATAAQVMELLCRDDDQLTVFLPAVKRLKHVFFLREDDGTCFSAKINFNKLCSLGFQMDRSTCLKYFTVNEQMFLLKNNRNVDLFNTERNVILDSFEERDAHFWNRVVLPWVCHVLEDDFEMSASELKMFFKK
jgi:hypothetical protein